MGNGRGRGGVENSYPRHRRTRWSMPQLMVFAVSNEGTGLIEELV